MIHNCKQCGVEFKGKPPRKYCSLECAWASKDRQVNHVSAYGDREKELIKQAYNENAGLRNNWLQELADKIGRSKQGISRYAGQQGWTDRTRTRNEENPGQPTMLKCTCTQCGKEFESHRNRRLTCSDTCLTRYRSSRFTTWHKEHEHPRGMAGKHHSKEYCEAISERVIKYWEEVTPEELEQRRERAYKTMVENGTLLNKGGYSRAKGGKREDLEGRYFRSGWEANYARYLNFMGVEWEYEADTFLFEAIKRGTRSYTPDFYIPAEDKRVEVKGYFDQKSRTKIKRLKKYYPDEFEKLHFVVSHLGCRAQAEILAIIGEDALDRFEYYKEINETLGGLIEGWE